MAADTVKLEMLHLAKAYKYQLHPAALQRAVDLMAASRRSTPAGPLHADDVKQLLVKLFFSIDTTPSAPASGSSAASSSSSLQPSLHSANAGGGGGGGSNSRMLTADRITAAWSILSLSLANETSYNLAQAGNASSAQGGRGKEVVAVPLAAMATAVVDEATSTVSVASAGGVPSDRMHVMRQRYHLALHRCLRRPTMYHSNNKTAAAALNHPVTATSLAASDSGPLPLLPLAALDGISRTLRIAVLGALVTDLETWFLEDPSNRQLLNVSQLDLRCLDKAMFCSGMLVVCVGHWVDSQLMVLELRMPSGEGRELTLSGMQSHTDFFGLAPSDPAAAMKEKECVESVVCVLAQVHLDNPATMQRLQVFFTEFQNRQEKDLAETTFVFVGDFCSRCVNLGEVSHVADASSSGRPFYKGLFDALAALLFSTAPLVAQHANFIFVPGPNDPSLLVNAMPQPPIPAVFTTSVRQRLRKCIFASNPARLRFFTQEIVVCRHNLYHLFQSRAFKGMSSSSNDQDSDVASSSTTAAPAFPYEKLVKTVVDQAHIMPLDNVNILWKYDTALRLLPVPHTIILCDRTEQWECSYQGSKVINPGSFTVSGTFLWYTPSDKEHALNTV